MKFVREMIAEELSPAEAEKRLLGMGFPPEVIADSQRLHRLAAKRKRRKMRNKEILRRALVNNESKTDLAAEYDLSRPQVHRIIEKGSVWNKDI